MADDAAQALLAAGVPLTLGRGRRAKPLRVDFVRNLEPQDLLKAGSEEAGSRPPALKSIRQTHHTLARVLAQGLPQEEVSAITGFSVSRISILKSDPSFIELFEYYRAMEAKQYSVARADMHERLSGLGFTAVEELQERLLDQPDAFDNKTLLAIVEATADRTGHGKTSTVNTNVSHSLSDESIARLKTAVEAGHQIAPQDRDALLRLAAAGTTEAHTQVEEAEWEPCEGAELREEGNSGTEGEVPAGDAPLSQVVPIR